MMHMKYARQKIAFGRAVSVGRMCRTSGSCAARTASSDKRSVPHIFFLKNGVSFRDTPKPGAYVALEAHVPSA